MCLHFKNMQINFISKVSRVHKATTVTNDTSLCFTILVLFLEFHPSRLGLKSHMHRQQKIRPGNRASPVTGHIWRGPNQPQRKLPVLCFEKHDMNVTVPWERGPNDSNLDPLQPQKNMRNAPYIHRKSKTNCWNSKATTWTQYFENEVAYDSQAFSFAFDQPVR